MLQIERKVEKQRIKTEMEERLQEYDWKLAAIDEMIVFAKGNGNCLLSSRSGYIFPGHMIYKR